MLSGVDKTQMMHTNIQHQLGLQLIIFFIVNQLFSMNRFVYEMSKLVLNAHHKHTEHEMTSSNCHTAYLV